MKQVTLSEARVHRSIQYQLVLRALHERGGRGDIEVVYRALNDYLRPQDAILSPQGQASVRKTVNTYMSRKGLVVLAEGKWVVTPAGLEQIAADPMAEVTFDTFAAACRRPTLVQRLVRSPEVLRVKQMYAHACQVCDTRLVGGKGPFSEAAHVHPVGTPHGGPDVLANVICLCPNHHSLFDRGAFVIEDDLTMRALVPLELRRTLRMVPQHRLDTRCLDYRRRMFLQPINVTS